MFSSSILHVFFYNFLFCTILWLKNSFMFIHDAIVCFHGCVVFHYMNKPQWWIFKLRVCPLCFVFLFKRRMKCTCLLMYIFRVSLGPLPKCRITSYQVGASSRLPDIMKLFSKWLKQFSLLLPHLQPAPDIVRLPFLLIWWMWKEVLIHNAILFCISLIF